jgi:hypothetical protein
MNTYGSTWLLIRKSAPHLTCVDDSGAPRQQDGQQRKEGGVGMGVKPACTAPQCLVASSPHKPSASTGPRCRAVQDTLLPV